MVLVPPRGVERAVRWAARHEWRASGEGEKRWPAAPERLRGLVVEVGGQTGRLTVAVAWMAEVQRRGGRAAWVAVGESVFFPPDAVAAGVDLAALPVVRPGGTTGTQRVLRGCEAVELLLHEGGIAFVVLDLVGVAARLPRAAEHRLEALVRAHRSTVCVLTDNGRGAAGCGARVGWRLRVGWRGDGAGEGEARARGKGRSSEARREEVGGREREERRGGEGDGVGVLQLETVRRRGGVAGGLLERRCALPPGLC